MDSASSSGAFFSISRFMRAALAIRSVAVRAASLAFMAAVRSSLMRSASGFALSMPGPRISHTCPGAFPRYPSGR